MAKLYRGVGDYQPTTTLGLKTAGEQTSSRISFICLIAGRHTEIYTRLYYIIMIEYQLPVSWVFINSIRSYRRPHDLPMSDLGMSVACLSVIGRYLRVAFILDPTIRGID